MPNLSKSVVLKKAGPAASVALKAVEKASQKSGLDKVARKYFPKADFAKPSPDDLQAPLEPQVRTAETIMDVSDTVQGLTAVAPKVASALSITPAAATTAAIGTTNAALQKAGVVGQAALTGIDLARVAASPAYREELKRDAQRIAESKERGAEGLAADSYEMLKYMSSRPMSGGKVFWDAMNQLDTDRVNAELKADAAKRRADKITKDLEFEQKLRSGELTPKMDRLRSERLKSK